MYDRSSTGDCLLQQGWHQKLLTAVWVRMAPEEKEVGLDSPLQLAAIQDVIPSLFTQFPPVGNSFDETTWMIRAETYCFSP